MTDCQKRKYDRDWQARRRLEQPERCRATVRRYRIKHPYIPVVSAKRRNSDAAKRRWATTAEMRAQKKQLKKDLTVLQQVIRGLRSRLRFPEINRQRSLEAYHARGKFKLRKRDLRAKLESAIRRIDRARQRRPLELKRAAIRMLRRVRDEAEKKIAKALRRRLEKVIKGYRRKTEDLIGCPVQQLRAHLETQFTGGMSWDTYGLWHIDHIRPCAKFDLRIPEQQRQCFNFTNLQPLWAGDNLKKRDI